MTHFEINGYASLSKEHQNIGHLRAIKNEDLELIRFWRNAPEVRRSAYTRHEISNEEHQAWWAKTRLRKDQQYWLYEKNKVPFGVVGLTAIDIISRNCSWTFYTAPKAPLGVGAKMECLALEQVFHNLNLHKLYCEVLAFNTPVIKLHQKFGFQTEGIFRQHHLVGDTYIDVHRLSLLKQEWVHKHEEILLKLHDKPRC